jgi:hypothetical protein
MRACFATNVSVNFNRFVKAWMCGALALGPIVKPAFIPLPNLDCWDELIDAIVDCAATRSARELTVCINER